MIDRGITWKLLVSVGCLSVLSRIFLCVVSWFKSSQTCETTCAQAGCGHRARAFKGVAKISLQGTTPKFRRAAELQTTEGFQPADTWMRNLCSKWLHIPTCHSKEKDAQNSTELLHHFHIPALSRKGNLHGNLEAQLYKQIYRKSSTKTKHWLQQTRWCGGRAGWYFHKGHSSKNLK